MGGCRCIFRGCPVATARNPRMHFFHFPVKDSTRLLKWAQMSHNSEIVYLPVAQLKNKVVCARHFRDECFMNYMRNKLVASAVPTLDRLKGGYALDYDTDGNIPTLIKLKQSKLPHMIPPKDFICPLELEDDNEIPQPSEALQKVEDVLSEDTVYSMSLEDDELMLLPRPAVISQKKETSKLNSSVTHKRTRSDHSAVNCKKLKQIIQPETAPSVEEEFSFSVDFQNDDLDILQDEEIEVYDVINSSEPTMPLCETSDEAVNTDLKIYEEKGIQVNITKNIMDQEQENFQMKLEQQRERFTIMEKNMSEQLSQLHQALGEAYRQNEVSKLKLDQLNTDNLKLTMEKEALSQSNEKATAEITKLLATVGQRDELCEKLKQELDNAVILKTQLESKNYALQQQQVTTVSTSKNISENPSSSSPAASNGMLTKAQLFNCVKKYLSSSMVALVRMEMYGSSERAWKADEKEIALDLYGLGENVYKYFSDEWRFRLPGLREVKLWSSEAASSLLDEDEDL